MEEQPNNFINIQEVVVKDNFAAVEDRKPVINVQNHNPAPAPPAELEAKGSIQDEAPKDATLVGGLETKNIITGMLSLVVWYTFNWSLSIT